LEYNVEKDAAFCFCCNNFSPNTANSAAAALSQLLGTETGLMLLIRAKVFLSMNSQKFIQTAIQTGKSGKSSRGI
jgi:hypothetical protein